MKNLNLHTELFNKTTGQMYYFMQQLNESELLCCMPVTSIDVDGEEYQDTSEILAIVKACDVSEEEPNVTIPHYLSESVDRANAQLEQKRKDLKNINQQIAEARTSLYREKDEQRKRIAKFPKKVKEQLELVIDHLEGVDLYVSYLRYDKLVVTKMSELKDGDSFRMVGLHHDLKGVHCNAKDYDWCIHTYSDDSGSRDYCFVARTEEEIAQKWADFATERGTSMFNDSKIRALVNSGFVKDKRFVDRAEESQKQQEEQRIAQEQREIARLTEVAKKLGLKVSK